MGDGLVVDGSLTPVLLLVTLAAWIGPIVVVALQVGRVNRLLWLVLFVVTVAAGPFGILAAGAAWLLARGSRREGPRDDALAATAALRRVPSSRRR